MNEKAIGVIIICSIIITASFLVLTTNFENGNIEITSSENETPSEVGNITSFDEAVNAFAFNFYNKFYNDPENSGNIFLSPYSIFTALAMTYEGAKNLTAEEMASVLNIEQDNESFHEYMHMLYERLNENSEYNISTANALWSRVGYQLLQDYINVIETYYGGEVSEVDYSNPEKAAEIINSWVENQTNNLIHNLVPPSTINPFLTMLILTNAIYFKGTWEIQFDEDNTTDRPFTMSSGETINVPTMCLTNTQDVFNYTETNEMQILELPYSGGEISMLIFLPREGYDLSNVLEYLDKDTFSDLIESMNQREVDIYLPKFKIETPLYKLKDYLIDLGMPTAFSSDNADFSGINGNKGLFISKVLHKAFIEVNEEGTEAAAATAVIMDKRYGGGSSSMVTFDCDHPFLFTIYHKATNTILFMGNVDNPLG